MRAKDICHGNRKHGSMLLQRLVNMRNEIYRVDGAMFTKRQKRTAISSVSLGCVAFLLVDRLARGRKAGVTNRAKSKSIFRVGSDKKLIYKSTRKAFKVKKTGRLKLAREIIARVKKEMQEPRLTESVRKGMHGKTSLDPSAIRLEKV